ncbi:hypothetical protein [Burkholderia gladioli]|uniref:hypothetical protein n=1 Tax=Burkholderia gladioli TaxID=28095 RepID=UPI00163FA6F9|nr:hypothetical protein [Burkholderia gladioli]
MASILPNGKTQFIDQNGRPLVGGKVFFYEPNTETFKDTYTDASLATPNPNPVILDGKGQATIWGNGSYRQVVFDRLGNAVWDQVVTSSVDPTDLASAAGAGMIGLPDGSTLASAFLLGLNRVVDSIAALRALPHAFYQRAFVTGYYAPHDGGGGNYQYDASDTSSLDNGCTIIVAADGARWKLQYFGFITLRQAGAKMDYKNGIVTTDDSAALTRALNALSTTGGEVRVDANGVAYIGSSQTIPAGVTLRGPFDTPDSVSTMQTNPITILTLGGAIALKSTATISMSGGSSVNGVLMYRSGISIPSADSTAFAGTAFTVAGPGVSIRNTLAVGFNQLVISNGYERLKLDYFFGDGQNGIEITDAKDIPRLSHVHLWPFATYSPTGAASANYRTGNGIYIHDGVDGALLFDCFVYGYAVGFNFKNISTVRWTNCFADGVLAQTGSIGLLLSNFINGLLGTGNAIWNRDVSVSVQMASGQVVDLVDLKLDGANTAGIDLIGGAVDVTECLFNNMPTCLKVENLNVEAYFDHNQYSAISGDVVSCVTAGTTNIIIGPNNFDLNNTAGGKINSANLSIPGLTAASSLSINSNFHNYFVLGSASIGSISSGWKDRIVRLRFTGVATVVSSTGSSTSIRLSGGTNYTASNGSILSLMHDGVQWYEIGRTA